MKNSNNFKILWWAILVISIGYYLFGRYPSLIKGEPSYFDVVVFLVWIGVCLAPIFQEMDIFGVKLKQKIDDLNKDFNHQLSILKIELMSSIRVSNANSNQIYFQNGSVPPKDSEIPNIRQVIQDVLKKMGIASTQEVNDEFEVESDYITMFKVRYSFENLLRKYVKFDEKYHNRYSIGRIINDLRNYDTISKEVLDGVKDIISICNYAIHGERITDAQVSFVRESASGLFQALEKELKTLESSSPNIIRRGVIPF